MTTKVQLAILGGGTYGCYLAKRLSEELPDDYSITLIDVGDNQTRSESDIGFSSTAKKYKGAKQGRYFGIGGTTKMWGGQILFLDEFDNPCQDALWERQIQINEKYKNDPMIKWKDSIQKVVAKSKKVNKKLKMFA